MRKALAVATTGLAFTFGACSSGEDAPTVTPTEGFTATYGSDSNRWSVACEGPYTTVEVEPGDTLLHLVLNNTVVMDQNILGRPNLPRKYLLQAIADINHLSDINTIEAGQQLSMPESCHLSS